MTRYEMAEAISRKMHVTMEQAQSALEAGDWNLLTATHLLEKEGFNEKLAASQAAATAVQYAPEAAEQVGAAAYEAVQAEAEAAEPEVIAARGAKSDRAGAKARRRGLRNVGEHIRRLVACGNRNRFEVRRGNELVIDLPVTALAVALIFAFWVCVPLLVIGLFTGWRYSFSGRELGRESINSAMRRAAEVAGGR